MISSLFSTVHRGRLGLVSVVGALALGAAGIASAQITGINGSPHDLVDGTGQSVGTAPAGTGICVFCHTPHGSDTGASAPLWNRALDTAQTYQRYSDLGTATLDGAEVAVGSVSLACLSCHDGTQAMDAVFNTPGSGMGSNFNGTFSPATATPLGNNVTMAGTPVPNLGTDLRNDHPISIQYAGGGCSTGNVNCTVLDFGDADFVEPQTTQINNIQFWWLDVATAGLGATGTFNGTAGQREKHDILLYTRDRTTAGADGTLGTADDVTTTEPFVECGSCHDPHNGGTTPVNFMRVNNANSAVCLACHNK